MELGASTISDQNVPGELRCAKFLGWRIDIELRGEQSHSFLLSIVACCAAIVQAVQPITVQGSHFVTSVTKKRFYVVGVEYADHMILNLAVRYQSLIGYIVISPEAPLALFLARASIR